jgi:hypothetical protein
MATEEGIVTQIPNLARFWFQPFEAALAQLVLPEECAIPSEAEVKLK